MNSLLPIIHIGRVECCLVDAKRVTRLARLLNSVKIGCWLVGVLWVSEFAQANAQANTQVNALSRFTSPKYSPADMSANNNGQTSLNASGSYLPLPVVMMQLAEASGINLVIEDKVSQSVHIYWQDIPPRQALKLLCTNQSIWCQWQAGERPATWDEGSSLLVHPASSDTSKQYANQSFNIQSLNRQSSQWDPSQSPSQHANSAAKHMLWVSHLVPLNYADAVQVAHLLNTATATEPSTGLNRETDSDSEFEQAIGANSLLGGGTATVDTYGSQILLWLPNTHIDRVLNLISRLDKPLPQVQIEARVLIANQDATRNLGRALRIQNNSSAAQSTSLASTMDGKGLTMALGLVSSHILLNLELSALEVSGQIFTLAQPQVVVQSGQNGRIATGQEVPYIIEQKDGKTQQWKQAVLGLNVKPLVLAGNEVMLDVSVVQDSVGELLPNGALALNTHQLQTQVRMQMGQTLVLGGALYEQQLQKWLRSPILGGVPVLSEWLKSQRQQTQRMELLVFVTPRLVGY